MEQNLSTRITGWAFIASALMFWFGWLLLPVRIGAFFQPGDFSAVYDQFHFWIWTFRIHLFGIIVAVVAMVALGSVLTHVPARILIWPGVAVATIGLMVGAAGEAFYYHFGAWGALDMHGKSAEVVSDFVASLKVGTEYVTCLVRFGRVFGGFGLLLLGLGILSWKVLPAWAGIIPMIIGVAAMALTMGLPDDLEEDFLTRSITERITEMAVAQDTFGSYLAAARELAPRVAAAADRTDRERELPPEIAGEIADKGFFRLLVPRSLGGAEIDYIDYLDIIRTFAEADGSTAWCINQNNVFSTVSAKMPESTAREIWSDERAVVANGPPTSAEAVPVTGGYRLTGRWNFSSGCRHATWMAAVAPVQPPDGDRDRKEVRTLLIPKKDVDFVDIWQVSGLRGTGSFSFEVENLYVPDIRTFNSLDSPREEGALYVMPMLLLFASGFASVALGVARASLDAAIELAGGKRPRLDRDLLRDKPVVHRQIGQAEAVWGSARAFLLETASAAWESACKVHALTLKERIRLRLAATHAIRMAAEVVDIAYNLCGSDTIFASNPIQRRFQDIHVITQQIQGRMAHYDAAGQFFLGLEPEGQF